MARAKRLRAGRGSASQLPGRRVSDFRLPLQALSLIETRNGMMPESTNDFARRVGRLSRMSGIGGSDAHTLSAENGWLMAAGMRDSAR